MPYIITDSEGDEIVIPDGGLNQDYSISLVGRNYENYGSIIAKTQVGLLENFASSNPPPRPTDGQLWYDKDDNLLRVYDSTNASWLNQTPLIVSGAPSNVHNQIVNGFMYFNTSLSQLYIYANGSYYRANSPGTVSDAFSGSAEIGNPTEYGTNVRNIFLYDTAGVPRNVLAVVSINNGSGQPNLGSYYQNEQLIAIFSTHAEFTVSDSPAAIVEGTTHPYGAQLAETGGIGLIIRPGINVRKDSTATSNYAKHARRAGAAYNINTGSFTLNSDGTISDNGGANVAGGNIYHRGTSIISDSHDTYTIGNSTTTFSEGYFTDIYLGNGTQGNILPNGSSDVNIGSPSNTINNLYSANVIVTNNISFPSGGDLGNVTNRIENAYFTNLFSNVITVNGDIDYTLPYEGAEGQRMVLRFDGTDFFATWEDPINKIKNLLEDANKSILISTASVTENYNALRPDSSTTSYSDTYNNLTLSANVSYIRNLFQGSTYITYAPSNGKITLNYPDPFRTGSESGDWTWNPSDFVQISGDQIIEGTKTLNGKIVMPVNNLPAYTEYGIELGGFNIRALQSDVAGTPEQLSFAGSSGSMSISDQGDLYVTGDVSAFSDRRIKENVEPIDNALEKLKQLSGYTFNKTGQPKRSAGVIAQEVIEVLPEVVSENDEGLLSVAYGNMVALLIEAVKELTAEVEDLKAQLKKD